ncbi:MAG: hypothetical protein RLZZ416_504 [Candidatus Parcubacteria bacterium]|jgi:NifU-like protein involved in Fe-S cluster formation
MQRQNGFRSVMFLASDRQSCAYLRAIGSCKPLQGVAAFKNQARCTTLTPEMLNERLTEIAKEMNGLTALVLALSDESGDSTSAIAALERTALREAAKRRVRCAVLVSTLNQANFLKSLDRDVPPWIQLGFTPTHTVKGAIAPLLPRPPFCNVRVVDDFMSGASTIAHEIGQFA